MTGRPGSDKRVGERAVPEDLLRDVSLSRHRAGFQEVHASGFRRGIFLQPFDEFCRRIDRRRTIRVAAPADRGADRDAVLRADAPFVHRPAVRQTAVAVAGHREPGVGKAPAQRRVLLAVVHMAIDFLAVDFFHCVGEEIGDVFVGRPVDWHAEVIAIFGFERRLELRLLEPVVAEPVEIGELLIGQLIKLSVGECRKRQTDEIFEVEPGIGDVLAVVGHEIGERSADDVIVARMRADEVGVVHPEIVNRFAGLDFDFDLVDELPFVEQLVADLDAGDVGEGFGEGLRTRNHGCSGFPIRC